MDQFPVEINIDDYWNSQIVLLIFSLYLTNLAFYYKQATPAMLTSRISILPLMSKWFFIPNIFSL